MTSAQRPHFALLPFMAQGHLIPMTDLGRVLAHHGVKVTILTTPLNANKIEPVISRAAASGLGIDLVHLEFRWADVGLPQGVESIDKVGFQDMGKLFQAALLFKEQLRKLLQELRPFPNCLIADMCFPWAGDLARELGILSITFPTTSCFSLMCWYVEETYNNFEEEIESDTEYFALPGFPDHVEMTKAQLRGAIRKPQPGQLKFRGHAVRPDGEAFGTLINSFQELEPEYLVEFKKVTGKRIWCVGPVSLCNEDELDKAERGNKPSIGSGECLKWLDSREPSSVLYVCLGSLATLATSQLIEFGLALENSSHPFIWVVRDSPEGFEEWISESGFEDKVKDRGLLIRGWASQVLILSHPSVGGFFTHCGWNSTLEGISSGLPMLTWPVLGEQFCNERFIVDVIKTGVKGGVELPVTFGDAEKIGVQVKSYGIMNAINKLMDKGKDGEERRERAKKLGREAKRAIEEGGSTYADVDLFIQDVMKQQQNNNVTILDHVT